jgi:hypothetical protein
VCYNIATEEKNMTLNRSYTAELEYVIKNVLLPVYDRYYKEKGLVVPVTAFPPGFLKEIKVTRKECALFTPRNTDLN